MATATMPEAPTVVTGGSDAPDAPLVVLLHGRGSDERQIAGLIPHLPARASYAAVRAPIAEGGGYAWFANRGIGRPVASSLRETMDWFTGWLDTAAPVGRDVILVGFSGGAAFAGGLLLGQPDRYRGAAILHGTLPFDAGVPALPGRLAGVPVFVAQSDDDTVIPRELLETTWRYLTNASGAPTWASKFPGGHGLTREALGELAGWLDRRLQYLQRTTTPAADPSATWPCLEDGLLPPRAGERPEVTTTTPQEQLTQNAPVELQEELYRHLASLPGVTTGDSGISVPGARAFRLPGGRGPENAFLVPPVREFAHLHPSYDGSLHLALPLALIADLVAKGWGVAHPLAGLLVSDGFAMLFGPRTYEELDVVVGVVASSHHVAHGSSTALNG